MGIFGNEIFFFRLKWLQVWKVYTLSFLVLGLFMVALTGLTLLRYSHNLETCSNREGWVQGFWIFLLVTTILLGCLQIVKLHDILMKRHGNLISDWKARQERFYPLLDTISPVLGFIILFVDRLDLTVILIMYSSWQFERNLTMFPKVGKHVFINSQVTRTTTEFFLCYLIEILAFTISFHILLGNLPAFR